MLKVGDKFEQDGREYVAEKLNEVDFTINPCDRCAFSSSVEECYRAQQSCESLSFDAPYGVIFVEVKQ